MENDPKKELREIAPFLADLREQGTGFQVPEDFFSKLQEEVMEKVHSESEGDSPSVERPVFRILRGGGRVWAAAAAVAALFLAGLWFLQPGSDLSSIPLAMEDISTEEASAYLDATLEDYDLALIVEALDTPEEEEALFPELDPQMEEFLEALDLEEIEAIF